MSAGIPSAVRLQIGPHDGGNPRIGLARFELPDKIRAVGIPESRKLGIAVLMAFGHDRSQQIVNRARDLRLCGVFLEQRNRRLRQVGRIRRMNRLVTMTLLILHGPRPRREETRHRGLVAQLGVEPVQSRQRVLLLLLKSDNDAQRRIDKGQCAKIARLHPHVSRHLPAQIVQKGGMSPPCLFPQAVQYSSHGFGELRELRIRRVRSLFEPVNDLALEERAQHLAVESRPGTDIRIIMDGLRPVRRIGKSLPESGRRFRTQPTFRFHELVDRLSVDLNSRQHDASSAHAIDRNHPSRTRIDCILRLSRQAFANEVSARQLRRSLDARSPPPLLEGLPVLLLAPIRIGEHEGWADGLHPRPDARTTRLIRTGDDARKSAPPALRINPDPPIRQGAEVLFPYVIAKAEDREVRKLCRHADPKILAAERIVRIIGLTCEPTFDAFSQQPLVSVRKIADHP